MAVEVGDVLQTKREEILRIAAKHRAFNVRVFGSRSRREAGPDSDFDFLLNVGPGRSPWFPGGLLADLEDLLLAGKSRSSPKLVSIRSYVIRF